MGTRTILHRCCTRVVRSMPIVATTRAQNGQEPVRARQTEWNFRPDEHSTYSEPASILPKQIWQTGLGSLVLITCTLGRGLSSPLPSLRTEAALLLMRPARPTVGGTAKSGACDTPPPILPDVKRITI